MKLNNFPVVLILMTALLLVLSIPLKAQLDPTFGNGGLATTDISNFDKPVTTFILPDGKILVLVGSSTSESLSPTYSFVRYNSNGTIDSSYGNNGIAQLQIPFILPPTNSRKIYSAIRQTDGKIVLAGNDNNDGLLMRFNEDGTLDPGFANGGIHRPNIDLNGNDLLNGVFQQPDGKLVAVGTTLDGINQNKRVFLVRYETDGNLDIDFGNKHGYIIHSLPNSGVRKIAVQTNGKILAANDGVFHRFNSDGTVDNSFTSTSFDPQRYRDFSLLGNDKFLIAETESISDALLRTHTNMVISRFSADGVLDTTFGAGGKAKVDVTSSMPDDIFALNEQADGKIVVAGQTFIESNKTMAFGKRLSLVRLSADGLLDGKFLVTPVSNLLDDPILSTSGNIVFQPDGKIITVSTKLNANSDLLITRSTNVPLRDPRLHAVPFQFSTFLPLFRSEATVFRGSEQRWFTSSTNIQSVFGLPGDVVVSSDYIGNFSTELAMFRPTTGVWYIGKNYSNPGQQFISVPWGKFGDIPIPFDYDGDSKSDITVFRPENGTWYIRNSKDNSATILQWGVSGDKPVPGDYDGDGFGDIAVWRPSNGVWYVLRSSDNQPMFLRYGLNGDIPIQEDYDGDGKTDIGVFRPSNGGWYIFRSSDGTNSCFQWGTFGDIPIPADYDGDRKTDIGVFRPNSRNWYISNSSNSSTNIFEFGLATDIPAQGRN